MNNLNPNLTNFSGIIPIIYALLIIIYLAIAAAIIFHLLYYKINRRVATAMFFIYSTGSLILLILNYSFYRSVDWYQIFSNF